MSQNNPKKQHNWSIEKTFWVAAGVGLLFISYLALKPTSTVHHIAQLDITKGELVIFDGRGITHGTLENLGETGMLFDKTTS